MARSLFEDLSYNAKWLTSLVVGKGALGQVEHAVASGPALNLLQGVGIGTAGTAFGFVLIPSVVGLSAGLAQLEHQHHRTSLCDEFRDEIAARVGKNPKQVTNADMDAVAKGTDGQPGNEALHEALHHSRKERNNMVMLSIISTFVAMAATKVLTDLMLGSGAGLAAGLGLKMAVGITTYFAVKRPLHWLASKINGLDEPTVADKVAGIARDKDRGKEISQEKIFDVYLSANPELADQIKNDYGKEFKELSRHVRADVLNDYGSVIGLESLTASINAGMIKPTEIAFLAYGESSGVAPRPRAELVERPKSLLDKLMGLCNDCLKLVTQYGPKSEVEKPHEYNEEHKVTAPLLEPATRAEKAEERTRNRHSFVEMVGRRSQAALEASSHVERLALQQAEKTPGPQLGG